MKVKPNSMEKEKVLKEATKRFLSLKNKLMSGTCVGGKEKEKFGSFFLKVDGFWEKADWFRWQLEDLDGNILLSGIEYL